MQVGSYVRIKFSYRQKLDAYVSKCGYEIRRVVRLPGRWYTWYDWLLEKQGRLIGKYKTLEDAKSQAWRDALDEALNRIDNLNLSEEDLARLAARILNLGSMPAGAYQAFKEELSDDNWTELENRILDGD